MNNFQYVRADGLEGAARFVAGHTGAKFIGGGTNLVDLMKYNVEKPSALVDLTRLSMRDVTELPDGGLRIDALPITAAPDSTVRLPARISVSTSIRFKSRSLIRTSPIPLVSFLMGGNLSFLMGAYRLTIQNHRYQTSLKAYSVCTYYVTD